MTPRDALNETIRYLSAPERMHETREMRMGLSALLADLPRTAPIPYPTQAYRARKQIHVKPNHVLDEA
jgi:hypothetical protein